MAQYWHLLPSTGFTAGFIPRSEISWSSQMDGWFECLGARGIITVKNIPQQAQQASSNGYVEIMSNGYNGLDGVPGDAPSVVTTIYLDEPLSQNANYGNHWNSETLAELAAACSAAGKVLAIGESMGPGTEYPPYSGLSGHIEDIISAIPSQYLSNVVIMPMHYFNNGWSPAGVEVEEIIIGSINKWWDALKVDFPTVNFAPWLAPTCDYPNPTSGCNAEWLRDALDYANSLGWKKVYFYLDDGFAFPTGVRNALLDSGWAYRAEDDVPANGCAYNIGAD